MICPYCGYENQLVINKRSTNSSTKNWRRRKCVKCLKVFTTYEGVKLDYIIVVKRNGSKVRFKREKMLSSIYTAYMKRKNVDSGDCAVKAENITGRIEMELITKQIKRISTEELSLMIIEELSKDDFSTTLNYISYYIVPNSMFELKKIFKD